jgi:uncharacterized protein
MESTGPIRIAAAGDVHIREANCEEVSRAFAGLEGRCDAILVAGDLTTHGEPAQAELFAQAVKPLHVPTVVVLGNHDLHADRGEEFRAALEAEGIVVLERETTVLELAGQEVGIVGLKGFVGGFAGSNLPDFGEKQLRDVYATTGEDVAALERGLSAIANCPFRIVLLHYSPSGETLEGEPPGIWAFLGSDRLAAPLLEHRPDLVLHGHAHAGRLETSLEGIPVFNVSVPVMRQDFWVFELSGASQASSAIH